MSASTDSAIPGYCTLIATSPPCWVRPRYTWPMLADAAGSVSMCARTRPGASPQSLASTLRIWFQETAGAPSRSDAKRLCRYADWSSSSPGNSIVESTWPAFIAAPRITAS